MILEYCISILTLCGLEKKMPIHMYMAAIGNQTGKLDEGTINMKIIRQDDVSDSGYDEDGR